jgi:hypothetical protein
MDAEKTIEAHIVTAYFFGLTANERKWEGRQTATAV